MKAKILTNVFTLISVACATTVAFGQCAASEPTGSLLYEISGNKLAKPSYLLGTFHAICSDNMVAFEKIDPHLAKTDRLLMEVDLDDPAELLTLSQALTMPSGKTLEGLLTPEQFAKVDAMTRKWLGYSATNVSTIKPMMVGVLVITSPKAIGCTPTPYELSLMQYASARKKPVLGLETVNEQMKFIDSKPLESHAKDLYEIASDTDKAIAELKKLMAVYKAGDAEKLYEVGEAQIKPADREYMLGRLIKARNTAWVPKIEASMKEAPTFIAVGAAHLGGGNGLIKLLRAKGYEVRPVRL